MNWIGEVVLAGIKIDRTIGHSEFLLAPQLIDLEVHLF